MYRKLPRAAKQDREGILGYGFVQISCIVRPPSGDGSLGYLQRRTKLQLCAIKFSSLLALSQLKSLLILPWPGIWVGYGEYELAKTSIRSSA